MRPQHFRAVLFRPQPVHNIVPQRACRAQLGDLHEEIHANAEKEAKPPGEGINIEARFHRAPRIFLAIGNGESEFLNRRRAGLVHVITADGNAVEFRHIGAGITDNIRHDPHAGLGRIDIGVAHHEFFENVVLDGARQLLCRYTLTLARDDIKRQNRDHRTIHGHGYGHRVERDLVEQNLHIRDRINRHASLAHIAHNTRMIAVITAMCGQIEGDRQPLLPRGQIAAVKCVGFLGRGKARILPDRPWTPRIHARLYAARERSKPWKTRISRIRFGIERLDIKALRRFPSEIAPFGFFVRERVPVGYCWRRFVRISHKLSISVRAEPVEALPFFFQLLATKSAALRQAQGERCGRSMPLKFRFALLQEGHSALARVGAGTGHPLRFSLLNEDLLHRSIKRQIDVALHHLDRLRRPVGQFFCQGPCFGHKIVGFHRFIDQAPFLGLLGTDFLAQHHHPGGPRAANRTGQQPGRSAIGHQTNVDKGLQEIRFFRSEGKISRKRERTANPSRRAIDRTDHRHIGPQYLADGRVVMILQRLVAAPLGRQRACFSACGQICARAKALALARNQNSARVTQIIECLAQLVRHLRRHSVQPVGPVHRDDFQRAVIFDADCFVGHLY